jgi:hypothetical protein
MRGFLTLVLCALRLGTNPAIIGPPGFIGAGSQINIG